MSGKEAQIQPQIPTANTDVGKGMEKDTNRNSSSKKKLKESEDYDKRCKFKIKQMIVNSSPIWLQQHTQYDIEDI